jgi:C1A family cysteine protease
MPSSGPVKDGWHRDLPDGRDFTVETAQLNRAFKKLAPLRGGKKAKVETVDLREWLPRVPANTGLKDCVAQSGVALVQYFERRSTGHVIDASPLFLYKMARRLLGWPGDCGAQFRPALRALVRFGLPPAVLCETDLERFDGPPDACLFSYADLFREITYLRLDSRGLDGRATLERIKSFLRAGFPCTCGFPLNSAIDDAPDIPFPTDLDQIRGGSGVLVVGYDDRRRHRSTRGAFLVRTSWSEGWGDRGHGWLPFAYVLDRLSADFWTLVKPGWLESGEFLDPRSE